MSWSVIEWLPGGTCRASGDVAIMADQLGSSYPLSAAYLPPLSQATVRLHCRNAKSIFADAKDRELISKNPFAKLKSSAVAADRSHYVTPEEASTIREACPTLSWRVLFGLCRHVGLRCPSETHRLAWSDVDWSERTLKVFAPKTETIRTVPLWPQVYDDLRDAYDLAEEGSDKIVEVSANKSTMHRQLRAIITKAGLTPWADLFQTLRRSAETDFAKDCPQHAVSRWMGHSIEVSGKHYTQQTSDIFERVTAACESSAKSAAEYPGTGSHDPANDEEGSEASEGERKAKPAPCGVLPLDAGLFSSEADGNRTRNHRIDSPVL